MSGCERGFDRGGGRAPKFVMAGWPRSKLVSCGLAPFRHGGLDPFRHCGLDPQSRTYSVKKVSYSGRFGCLKCQFNGYVRVSCCKSSSTSLYWILRASDWWRRIMERNDFGKLLAGLVQLTEPQRKRLRQALDAAAQSPLQAVVAALPPPQECPHCRADQSQLRPWGQSCGLARLRCQACLRTFNALTATPLAHLRKREHWLGYVQALIDGLSLRQAATRCGVDKDTALRWRHRFLAAAANHRAEREGGIVEADETFFLESFKGQRHLHRPARKRGGTGQVWEHIAVLVVRDRSGRTADFPLERADTEHIAAVLPPPRGARRHPLHGWRRGVQGRLAHARAEPPRHLSPAGHSRTRGLLSSPECQRL